MPHEELHKEKKVKNYLLLGILAFIVLIIFSLAMVKIRIHEVVNPAATEEELRNPIQ